MIQQIAEVASKIYSNGQHPEVKVRTTCRSCESGRLQNVLDLGNLYVSNFADVADSARWPCVPLDLILCEECGLVLPWHFMDEIQVREHDFLARGGNLLAPLPDLRTITSTEWSAIA